MDHLYIFLHNPKTGGTTFNGHCVRELEFQEEFIHLGRFGRKDDEVRDLPPFAKRPLDQRSRARVIGGHAAYVGIHELVPGKVARYFTFLRRPADRLASEYNGFSTRKKNIGLYASFDDWYADQPRDPMTRRYNRFARLERERADLGAAKQLLDSLWFVGVTESLDEDLRHVFAAIGISTEYRNLKVSGEAKPGDLRSMDREIPRVFTLDDERRRAIDEENPLDVELYRHALALHDRGARTGP